MIIWMDLEMTGLDPDTQVIVEIATLVTDDELNIVEEGPDLVIFQPDEALAANANLHQPDAIFLNLSQYLDRTLGVTVRIEQTSEMKGALRRYDADRRILWLSEVLRRGSRNFQLAHQIGLLAHRDAGQHLLHRVFRVGRGFRFGDLHRHVAAEALATRHDQRVAPHLVGADSGILGGVVALAGRGLDAHRLDLAERTVGRRLEGGIDLLERGVKTGIASIALRPTEALVDPDCTDSLPGEVVRQAKAVIMDTLGCAIAGYTLAREELAHVAGADEAGAAGDEITHEKDRNRGVR